MLSLTKDEQTLHHHAAMLKNELEAYRTCTHRDEVEWKNLLRARLVS